MKLLFTKCFVFAVISAICLGCAGPGSYQGAATPANLPPVLPMQNFVPAEPVRQVSAMHGLYHTVAPRETLYRISQTYGVSIEDIMKANRLKDPNRIRKGQALYIPQVRAPEGFKDYVSIPLFNNPGRWKYIVIHHTATHTGNLETIDLIHKRRGFGELGYHFLIDNGTKGRAMGQIEVGHRWLGQRDGAHARTDNMNHKGIGIALIGNFSQERISEVQLRSLVSLVNTLRYHYKIPKWRIIGHRDVRGAATECPGKLFPWQRFKRMLDEF